MDQDISQTISEGLKQHECPVDTQNESLAGGHRSLADGGILAYWVVRECHSKWPESLHMRRWQRYGS
jgi:hypothetical protein